MSLRTKLHPMGGGKSKKIFVRPNLTANGTIWGDAFAVTSGNNTGLEYRAVDGRASLWVSYTRNVTFVFYNPIALNVTQLILDFGGTYYIKNPLYIRGKNSEDSSTTLITSTASGLQTRQTTITLDNNNYYKYYSIGMAGTQNNIRLSNIDIVAFE